MSSKLSTLVGQELAGFKLTRLVGEGGMAAVFCGENLLDSSIRRAIKVVQPALAADEEFTKRFAEEARVLERLQHPNVVRFFGARWEGEHLLMELELLDGAPLSDKLPGRHAPPLPVDQVVDWMLQACQGVSAAHELGVVHRDLKPDNLFYADGVIKVLDFGIARALDEADRASSVTRAGTVPGTPAYLAPEVCKKGVPSKGSDVYALGMTLLELLLGYHPLMPPGQARRSSTEIMFAQVREPMPALRSVREDAPESLERVVARATDKDPDQRYATAASLAAALRSLQAGLADTDLSPHISAPDHESLPPWAEDEPATTDEGAAPEQPAGEEPEQPPADQTGPAAPQLPSGPGPQTAPQQPSSQETPDIAVGVATPRANKGGGPGRWLGLGALLALIAGGLLWYRSDRAGEPKPVVQPPPAVQQPAPAPDARSASRSPSAANPWITIAAPAQRVVLGIDPRLYSRGLDQVVGFRPAAGVVAPTTSYQLQQHEVTWGELDPWLAAHPKRAFAPPPWTPGDPARRKQRPATGVPWETARAYCGSLEAELPTEEQWEYAARGPKRRPNAWGASPMDLQRTRAYGGPEARPSEVARSEQDRTPGPAADALLDLTGNAQEWTQDIYRSDTAGTVEAWAQSPKQTFRAIRGLPLRQKPPAVFPREGAAFRNALCSSGCPAGSERARQSVGFRCARKSNP